MKRTIFIVAIIFILILAILIVLRSLSPEDAWICQDGRWVKHGQPAAPQPTGGCGPKHEINSFDDCVQAGYPVTESYPRQCGIPEGKIVVEDAGGRQDQAGLIKVDNPQPNQAIESPLVVSGEARGFWYFEASFPVKLYDNDNSELAAGIAQAQGEWMTENYVPFIATLEFIAPESNIGFLVLEKDNPSGLPENDDELRIPILFKGDIISVNVYFSTAETGGAPAFDCSEVTGVERRIPKTEAVGRAALEELFKGPTEAEQKQGYLTSVNPGIKIQELVIEDGIARVDFNEQLEFQVGGSCRVAAIRAQISKTLKQFPAVSQVIISINSRTDDILQP